MGLIERLCSQSTVAFRDRRQLYNGPAVPAYDDFLALFGEFNQSRRLIFRVLNAKLYKFDSSQTSRVLKSAVIPVYRRFHETIFSSFNARICASS
jgi:hypothetical protein